MQANLFSLILQGSNHNTHRALIVVHPCSLWPRVFSLLTMLYDNMKKSHLVIFLSSLFGLPKCCFLLFPDALYHTMTALYQVNSALCAGLSLRSVILILSNRG